LELELLTAAADRYQLRCRRIPHLLQPGKDLLAIHQHSQFTLLGATFNLNRYAVQVFLKFSGKTCRQLLLPSGCTVLNQNLHGFSPPAGFD